MAWLGNKKIDFAYWKGQWVSLDRILHPGRAIYYKLPSGEITILDLNTQGSIIMSLPYPLYTKLEIGTVPFIVNPQIQENLEYVRKDLRFGIDINSTIQNYFGINVYENLRFGIDINSTIRSYLGIRIHEDLRFCMNFKRIIVDIESIPAKAEGVIVPLLLLNASVTLADSLAISSKLYTYNIIRLDAISNIIEHLEPITTTLYMDTDFKVVPVVIEGTIYTFFENEADGYTYQISTLNYTTEEEQGGLTYNMEATYEGE